MNSLIIEPKHFEIRVGKTLYIVNSLYSGKESITDKLMRLITRKFENQGKEN